MPPSQLLMLRQKRIPRVQLSISESDVAPVVVKPLIISKKAVLYEEKSPEMTSGIAPKAAAITHVKVTKK